jgi:hypothetical protein
LDLQQLAEGAVVLGKDLQKLQEEPFLEDLVEVSLIHLTHLPNLAVLEHLARVMLAETDLLMLEVLRWVQVAAEVVEVLVEVVLVMPMEEMVEVEPLQA